MRTNTNQYEASHGKKPSGHGRWIFKMTGTDDKGRFTTYTGSASDTMTKARVTVARQFKSEVGGISHIVEVTVLP